MSVSPPKTSGQYDMNGFKRSYNLTAGLDYDRVNGAIYTKHEQRKKVNLKQGLQSFKLSPRVTGTLGTKTAAGTSTNYDQGPNDQVEMRESVEDSLL